MQKKLFHNTGHQFIDIPLAELLPSKDEDFIEQLALKNEGEWKYWRGLPWLLYQYKYVPGGKPLLKLAVETNLGMPSRGVLFDFDTELVDEEPDEDDIQEVYFAKEEAEIEAGDNFNNRVLRLASLPNKDSLPLDIELDLHWVKMAGRDLIDVDLIVDLGNTRTIAYLLESPAATGNENNNINAGRVSILRFLPRATPYDHYAPLPNEGILDDECAIIDSWLLLHRPQFHNIEPQESKTPGERVTRTKLSEHYRPVGNPGAGPIQYRREFYLPHTFVELSPALIGGGRVHPQGVFKILAGISLESSARFSLSSPKRYAWDEAPQGHRGGTYWKIIPNDNEPPLPDQFDDFKCLIRFFMEPSGADWDIDNPPDPDDGILALPSIRAEAEYPRRDAICWFALSILECAHRQINSPNYQIEMQRGDLPRRLRNIRVTFPAGWICEERERYLKQWQRAINLFTLTRFENHAPVNSFDWRQGGSRPMLIDDGMDEAVCSQLPVIYADVMALGGARQWVELYGKENAVTVMNVDIGGGTTDLAIIQYSCDHTHTHQSSLETTLLFRDGYTTAGDTLVKKLIEQILIPVWLNASCKESLDAVPDARAKLRSFFMEPADPTFRVVDSRASDKLMRITRLVFIPIINQWLKQLGEIDSNPEHSWEPTSIEFLLSKSYIDINALRDLNELTEKVITKRCLKANLWSEVPFAKEGIFLHTQIDSINEIIDEVFKEHFDRLGILAGRFDCDLVMVSGKPSELPRIRELIADFFPIIPQRIIHLKNFPAGRWYKNANSEGRIEDAKTCTVMGATLFQDMRNGNSSGLNIKRTEDKEISRRYFWGIVDKNQNPAEFHKNYLFKPSDYPEPKPNEESIEFTPESFILPVNCRIGRQLVPMPKVRAEPVYQLLWTPKRPNANPAALVKVTLRWHSALVRGEWLECVRIDRHPDFPDVDPEDIEFRLNTLFEDSFWLDDPHFYLPDTF